LGTLDAVLLKMYASVLEISNGKYRKKNQAAQVILTILIIRELSPYE
jgi:hypothetical protein